MLLDKNKAIEFAGKLLKIGSIRLSPHAPFTWASGWRSPIYCDNRLTLSFPDVRTWIKYTLQEGIIQKMSDVEIIAGVATAGVPHGALLADSMTLPFIYVRSEAKKHGLTNQIEGKITQGQKVVVVEDLISTGGSSLNAVHALRNAGAEVVGLVALFTYDFDVAQKAFDDAQCEFYTISDYPSLITYALDHQLIDHATKDLLEAWRKNPAAWMNN